MELVILLLVSALGALANARHGSVDESPDVQSPTLPGRVKRLERLLQQQTLALFKQEKLILQQQAQLAQQDVRLRGQDAELQSHTDLLQNQNNKLNDQAMELELHEQRLQEQDVKLGDQATELELHKQLLREQNVKLGEQVTELQLHKQLLQKHDVKLSRQEKLLSGYAHVFGQLNAGLGSQRKGCILQDTILQQPVSPTADDVKSARRAAAARDVMARSDDGGPLEAVVNRVSQQVTEMGAKLQAFKGQTAADLHTLQTQASQQSTDIQDARTSSFVHWGSGSCGGGGNASQLVYSGVVGGSYYGDSGSASNFLCLTLTPVSGNDTSNSPVAHLYGGEYQTDDSHQDTKPVCSVCRPSFSTTIMLPGTNLCSAGWTTQYAGYLMAGYHDHTAASEFICVDSRLESRIGGAQDQNGKLLYFTKAVCGSLPCPPYVDGKIVMCAVCSK